MKAGVIGAVDGTFRVVDSFTETVADDGRDLDRCLAIERVFSLPSGGMAFEGRAAVEAVATDTAATIEDGDVRLAERERVVTRHAEFVGVPGEFVVVDSGDGAFAFDLIGAETGTTIERATVDLDAFFGAHEAATPWRAGFYGTGDGGVNGIFHGDDLRDELGDVLATSSLNQVGLSYGYDGDDLKMTATRSGYVEVYRPTDFDSERYLEYLRDEIVPHVA